MLESKAIIKLLLVAEVFQLLLILHLDFDLTCLIYVSKTNIIPKKMVRVTNTYFERSIFVILLLCLRYWEKTKRSSECRPQSDRISS